jgi:anti-sigma-K factor RskA
VNAEIHTLTGAYALDALSDAERAMFEQHMAECASCAAEVAELQDTAVRLGSAVAVTPPAELKSRVLANVRRVRQLPPISTDPASTGSLRPRWQVWAAGLAAAASFVAAVVFGAQWTAANDRAHRGDERAAQAQAQLDAVAAVLTAPDAKITTATLNGARATAVVSHSQGKVAFTARDMPPLPSGRSYQAWLISPSGMKSVGLLASGAEPSALVGDLAPGETGIGVTVEPLGGSTQPSGDPVMQLDLP